MGWETGEQFGTPNFTAKQAYKVQRGFNELLRENNVKDEIDMAKMASQPEQTTVENK